MPCKLRIFVYRSYLPHLELQRASGRFFGWSNSYVEHDHNISCLEGPCLYSSFGANNIRQYTGEVPIYKRLVTQCPTTADPAAADIFLVPFFFGYMMSLGWQLKTAEWRAEHRDMMKAALDAKRLLPHLTNRTAARHLFLFTCDSQFVNIDLHPLLRQSLVVHLGDDAFTGKAAPVNYMAPKRSSYFMPNSLIVPYRVSQWLPFGFTPPVIGPRRLLVSMNVNFARHKHRKRVAEQLLSDVNRLNMSTERIFVSSQMMGPAEAGQIARESTFCICPTGDSKGYTARFYFVMLHGCLPVRVDGWLRNTSLAPPTYPFPGLIDWKKIVIDMVAEEIGASDLTPKLLQMPIREVEERQSHLRHAAHWLLYDMKDHAHHDAPAALVKTLQDMLDGT